jgi:hypothetical protein
MPTGYQRGCEQGMEWGLGEDEAGLKVLKFGLRPSPKGNPMQLLPSTLHSALPWAAFALYCLSTTATSSSFILERLSPAKMVQRLTYRRRHSYATKSNKQRLVKTPGKFRGRNIRAGLTRKSGIVRGGG